MEIESWSGNIIKIDFDLLNLTEEELIQKLIEAERELSNAEKNPDLHALSEQYWSNHLLIPKYYLTKSGDGSGEYKQDTAYKLVTDTQARKNTANLRLEKARQKKENIQSSLNAKQEQNDKTYDEATKINALVDYVLTNPDNWITKSIQSAQQASEVLDHLSDDLISQLDTQIDTQIDTQKQAADYMPSVNLYIKKISLK